MVVLLLTWWITVGRSGRIGEKPRIDSCSISVEGAGSEESGSEESRRGPACYERLAGRASAVTRGELA